MAPDRRRHRSAAPRDPEIFSAEAAPHLARAVDHLCWLLERGYARPSSLKLVGDRHALTRRQREAVRRCSCSAADRSARAGRRVEPAQLSGASLAIDGYNLLTTLESALGGGVLLLGRDGALRDMASLHGTWRRVAETVPALELAGEHLGALGVADCTWYLDRPVSNSGRLRAEIERVSTESGWHWQVELAADVDGILARSTDVVVSADSGVLDRCGRWFDGAREIVAARAPDAWVLDLSRPPTA